MRWPLLLLFFALAGFSGPRAQVYTVENSKSLDSNHVELIVLRDEAAGLEAAVAPERGGELCSFRVRYRNQWIETLYLACDYSPREGWTGKAPILWPATGRNFPPDLEERQKAGERFTDGAYYFKGKRYTMPGHGFARELPWTLEEKTAAGSSARALLSLVDTGETRKLYPFRFRDTVEYVLGGGQLQIRYKIGSSRENDEKMFFSLGNHITFVTPFLKGTDPRAMILTTPSSQEILKTEYGIPTGEVVPRSHAGGVRLGDFERRKPVSLTGYPTKEPYLILSDPQGLTIRISHEATRIPPQPVVLFNLWGDAAEGFFSPEPWVGLQNSLVLQKGLIYLDPGEEFEWTIQISVERTES